MVILSLIVKRARVKALVKGKRGASEAFGDYVEVSKHKMLTVFLQEFCLY